MVSKILHDLEPTLTSIVCPKIYTYQKHLTASFPIFLDPFFTLFESCRSCFTTPASHTQHQPQQSDSKPTLTTQDILETPLLTSHASYTQYKPWCKNVVMNKHSQQSISSQNTSWRSMKLTFRHHHSYITYTTSELTTTVRLKTNLPSKHTFRTRKLTFAPHDTHHDSIGF